MATFRISELRNLGRAATPMQKTASTVLTETVRSQTTTRNYDIFLSHAFRDAELILGVKVKLEKYGHSVYVDWVEDPQLDRATVTARTASALRKRMGCCRSLFYATTEASTQSKGMPWECGYVDGKCGRSAILPLTDTGGSAFKGQEYLGIYPYITEDPPEGQTRKVLWVNQSKDIYCSFAQWLDGKLPQRH